MNLQLLININDALKMARLKDRQRALDLRRKGFSYSQIKKEIGVSRGTLSVWLRDLPLSKKRVRELRDLNEQRIERYRQTRSKKKGERLSKLYQEQKRMIFPLSQRDLLIAGLFLYWGEGSKTRMSELRIANTDPIVPKFFVYWATRFLKFDKSKIKVHLHLYSDMDAAKEIKFWSSILGISTRQFIKPYVKKNSSQLINRGTFGHGTCTVRIGNARIGEKIQMGLKSIRDHFGT